MKKLGMLVLLLALCTLLCSFTNYNRRLSVWQGLISAKTYEKVKQRYLNSEASYSRIREARELCIDERIGEIEKFYRTESELRDALTGALSPEEKNELSALLEICGNALWFFSTVIDENTIGWIYAEDMDL